MNRRVPMPSPSGRNREGLFVASERGFGIAYDAAPAPKQRMTKRAFDRAYDHVVETFGQEAADALWNGMIGPAYAAEEQEAAEDETEADVQEHYSRLMDPESAEAKEAAKEAVSKDSKARDGLPVYSNKLPLDALTGESVRHGRAGAAMDSTPAAIAAMARRTIKIGPIF
jgi:hypothetical protein